jgi:acetate kinase
LSGLKAISGTDGDMRHILDGITLQDPDCMHAFDMYVYRLSRYIGSLLPALEKLDTLVFTGGIGENSPLVRAEACKRLSYLGIEIDEVKNQNGQGDRDISSDHSKVKVLVIHTEEEWSIAKAALSMLQPAATPPA